MSFTEFEIEVTLVSIFLLAESNEEPNPAISNFNLLSSVEVSLIDRKSTRLNSSHSQQSRMPSSA